jgi:hypothetical protein
MEINYGFGKIIYDPDAHLYELDGKPLLSVTELAKRFSKMNTEWLEAHPEYAERGTVIHNELAEYYDGNKDFADLSDTAQEIAGQCIPDGTQQTEVLVVNKIKGYAGTVDMVFCSDHKITKIVDFKSGTTVNMKYYICQLNLYRLALIEMGVDCTGVEMLIINPERTIKIPLKSWEECKNIAAGYEPDEETALTIEQCETELKELETYVDRYNKVKKYLQDLLATKMEETNTKSYIGNRYSYSYVAGSTRKTLDTDLVKQKLGNDYDSCVKETTTKASVRMTTIGE